MKWPSLVTLPLTEKTLPRGGAAQGSSLAGRRKPALAPRPSFPQAGAMPSDVPPWWERGACSALAPEVSNSSLSHEWETWWPPLWPHLSCPETGPSSWSGHRRRYRSLGPGGRLPKAVSTSAGALSHSRGPGGSCTRGLHGRAGRDPRALPGQAEAACVGPASAAGNRRYPKRSREVRCPLPRACSVTGREGDGRSVTRYVRAELARLTSLPRAFPPPASRAAAIGSAPRNPSASRRSHPASAGGGSGVRSERRAGSCRCRGFGRRSGGRAPDDGVAGAERTGAGRVPRAAGAAADRGADRSDRHRHQPPRAPGDPPRCAEPPAAPTPLGPALGLPGLGPVRGCALLGPLGARCSGEACGHPSSAGLWWLGARPWSRPCGWRLVAGVQGSGAFGPLSGRSPGALRGPCSALSACEKQM